MSEHGAFGRELLARSRLERTPTSADRARVFNAVVASGVLSGAATAAAAPSFLGRLGTVAGKWWLLGGVCLVLGVGGARLAVYGPAAQGPATAAAPRIAPKPVALQPEASQPSVAASVEPLVNDLPAPPKTAVPGPTLARSTGAAKLAGPGTHLEQEVSLLHAAHDAYNSGRPERALALIAQHRSRFPNSQLTNERATLEALALCRLGRAEGNCAASK